MIVLLDECVPAKLRHLIPEHTVLSACFAKLSAVRNGQLLALAEKEYQVLLTVDGNMSNQNKISKFKIGVFVIQAKNNSMEQLTPKLDAIREALKRIKRGQVIVV